MAKPPQMISVMTAFPHSVDRSATIRHAREFMREHHVHHLPVTEGGELCGVVTDRDIKLFLGPDFDYPDEDTLKVEDVYVEDAYIVEADASVEQVVQHMADRHIGSALVTRNGKLVGIFTTSDVCACYARELRRLYAIPQGNSAA